MTTAEKLRKLWHVYSSFWEIPTALIGLVVFVLFLLWGC